MPAFDAPQQLVLLVAPVVAYLLAARDPRRTRLQLIAAAALGGAAAGLFVCAVLSLGAPSLVASLGLWPWLAVYTVEGALIGLCGVIARAAGVWLSRRP